MMFFFISIISRDGWKKLQNGLELNKNVRVERWKAKPTQSPYGREGLFGIQLS